MLTRYLNVCKNWTINKTFITGLEMSIFKFTLYRHVYNFEAKKN